MIWWPGNNELGRIWCGKKEPWSYLKWYPGIFLMGPKETTKKNLLKWARHLADIWTLDLGDWEGKSAVCSIAIPGCWCRALDIGTKNKIMHAILGNVHIPANLAYKEQELPRQWSDCAGCITRLRCRKGEDVSPCPWLNSRSRALNWPQICIHAPTVHSQDNFLF
jgi:hypothetical protein